MKEIIKITLNLMVVFIVSGVILSLVYANAKPKIERNEAIEKEKALKSLMPEASNIAVQGTYEPMEGKMAEYYVAKDKDGKVLGYIASSYSKGYSSIINLLVAVGTDMKIKAINILHQEETPGLGDDIGKQYFQDRFKGKALDQLEVVKLPDPNKIEAVSGATISSRAATKGVRTGVEFLIKKYQGVSQ
ncbi:MAG: RnfABCDGE type electron transport complex subunit G [Nitrospiraceae bacterium]|nr:RnfABCDGE type electron transport complex subunit G [Nitrospiraceae bacterium]